MKKYGFNRRELTEKDFYEICEREGIIVLEMDVPTSFYFRAEGLSFIVIKKRQTGLRRLFSMFHELAHHFLHGGQTAESAFFFGLLETKAEIEADALATVALVPHSSLANFDFLENHPVRFAKQLFRNRQKLEFLYRI